MPGWQTCQSQGGLRTVTPAPPSRTQALLTPPQSPERPPQQRKTYSQPPGLPAPEDSQLPAQEQAGSADWWSPAGHWSGPKSDSRFSPLPRGQVPLYLGPAPAPSKADNSHFLHRDKPRTVHGLAQLKPGGGSGFHPCPPLPAKPPPHIRHSPWPWGDSPLHQEPKTKPWEGQGFQGAGGWDVSHPYLANLPLPSPTTHTTLDPLEFSSPQTPKQRLSKKGWQKNSSQSQGGVIQQDGPWAWRQRTQMPALALLGSHCATLGKLLNSPSFHFFTCRMG